MDIKKTWLVTQPIAHRGLHNDKLPENSIGAFENAIKNNFAIELDVRLTDDDEVVVFHDDTISRMVNSDGYVANIKWDDLKNYRLSGTEFAIPSFKEVLDFVDGRVPILIETKNTNKVGALEVNVAKLLKEYNGEVALQSFNPYSMEYFKIHQPQFLRGQLSTFFSKTAMPSFFRRYMLTRLKLNHISRPNFIAYDHNCLPNYFVTKTKLPVLAWTVRSSAEMEQVLPFCDNIIFEKFMPHNTNDE